MLHDFQVKLDADIDAAYAQGAQNVMPVSPTGSGKTVVIGHRLKKLNAPACAIAHRQELVGQIALALNREEVPHGIIAPKDTMREIIALEMETHGRSYYNPRAAVRVAGIDTLVNYDKTDRWLSQVQLVVQDEGHHVLRENKWGRTQLALFPTARGLYPTAHAVRGDRRGLGRHADGLVDSLVLGPHARILIGRGFLTDYRLICPPSDIDMSDVPVGDSGEYNQKKAAAKIHASNSIVGDVVTHYRKFAEGCLGVTFAIDIESAQDITNAYNAAGIPAAIIHGKTSTTDRASLMRKFRSRQLIQLVSVDVLGEGTDVPAIEVVSMARPTASFQLYAQQFGRALRVMVSDQLMQMWAAMTDAQRLDYIAASVKPTAIIIDHVNNYDRHGLPDKPRAYTLDRAERSRSQRPADEIPLRRCLNPECYQAYEAVLIACPHCGTPKPAPAARSSPEMVEGDLVELDPEVLRKLRGEIDRIDLAVRIPTGASAIVAGAIKRNHWERQQQQHKLRDAIALWAGWQAHQGRNDRESYRRFFFGFGVDVATAQTLNAKDAAELEGRIRQQLAANNVVKA